MAKSKVNTMATCVSVVVDMPYIRAVVADVQLLWWRWQCR